MKGNKKILQVRALYLVLCLYVLLMISRLLEATVLRAENAVFSAALLQLLVLIIPTVVYVKLMNEKKLPSLRLRAPRTEALPLIAAATVVIISGGLLIGIAFGQLKAFSGSFTLYDTFVSASDGSIAGKIMLFAAYAVLPAISEELVFRSIFCSECERHGLVCGVIVTSFFFGMLHFDLAKFPIYFFSGLVLAMITYATRSATSAMAVHLLYNAFAIAFQSQIYAFYNNAGGPNLFIFLLALMFLLSLAALFALCAALYRRYARRNYLPEYRASVSIKESLLNIGKILISPASVICILLFAITVTAGAIAGK